MSSPSPAPSVRALAAVFLRIVNVTFGGGDPTMAALYRELVERRRWLTAERHGLAYALARLTPGTNVLAFCAGVAWFIRGWRGAAAAAVAATIPSAALAVSLTLGYEAIKASPAAAGVIGGALAAAVGMMIAAAWKLARPGLRRREWPRTVGLVAASAALLSAGVQPLPVLGLAALAGCAWPRKDQP